MILATNSLYLHADRIDSMYLDRAMTDENRLVWSINIRGIKYSKDHKGDQIEDNLNVSYHILNKEFAYSQFRELIDQVRAQNQDQAFIDTLFEKHIMLDAPSERLEPQIQSISKWNVIKAFFKSAKKLKIGFKDDDGGMW